LKVRRPCQAGTFYAGTAESLRAQIEQCFTHTLGPGTIPKIVVSGPRNLVGFISPHAGYEYSGPVASHGFHHLAVDGKPEIIVIFGPNHTGQGSAIATMNEGVWRTPLGDAKIDTPTADSIVKESRIVDLDDTAHMFEHSIEVQLPFLQYLYGSDFRFVPIAFLMQDLESSREIGEATAKALMNKNAVIIASSDMTHYEPQKSVEKKDNLVIEAIEKMDESQLYTVIEDYGISACGYGPIVALITAAKALGARNAKLLCHATSGDVTDDFSSVVGYASIAFSK
jgi:AmmeMemoRadiSam system protein B